MTIEQIRANELNKLTNSIREMIKPRKDFANGRDFIFQYKDAVDAGLISRFEAREVLKYNNQPNSFPCFMDDPMKNNPFVKQNK